MRRFFCVLFCLGICWISGARNIYLVSVGIADYPDTGNDLSFPVNDARAIYSLYAQYAHVRAVLITDAKAIRQQILWQTQRLFNQAKESDIVIFYFSGHGYPGGFVVYDGLLSYEDVRMLFASCRAANKIIFADACFAGDIREHKKDRMARKLGVMLFLSSRNNEVSLESRQIRNGFFTACLLRGLRGGADRNRDGIVTAKELFVSVSNGVRKLSQNRQHPVMWGNFNDDMPVMVW